MTRPKKQTVDYFPHDCDCSNKKTLFILEQKYGNNGYAFWFKLLEVLGSSEGHIIDCSNSTTWEFLQARTRTGADTCNEILEILVNVEAIDGELWKKKRIWCDNFVQRIGSVYLNRRVEIPSKPDNYDRNPTHKGITTSRKPQTKLKETKLKETKLKEVKNIYTFWNLLGIVQHRNFKKFESHINSALNNYTEDEIKSAMQNYKDIIISDKHYWTHEWGLDEFLSRKGGIDKFMTINKPFDNFAKAKNCRDETQPEAEPGKYANVPVIIINNDE